MYKKLVKEITETDWSKKDLKIKKIEFDGPLDVLKRTAPEIYRKIKRH